MSQKFKLMISLAIFLGLLASPSFAATTYWLGDANNGLWHDANNWDLSVPNLNTDAMIMDPNADVLIDAVGQGVAALTLNATLTITSNGTLESTTGNKTIGNFPADTGVMNLNGGTVTVSNGNVEVGRYGNGTLNINSGLFDTSVGWQVFVGRWDSSTGHIQLDGGHLKTNFIDLNGPKASMDITGGKLTCIGNREGGIGTWVSQGKLTGYGDPANVVYSYDPGTNLTTVTAISSSDFVVVDDFDSYGSDPNLKAVWGSSAIYDPNNKGVTGRSMEIRGGTFVSRTTPFIDWTQSGVKSLQIRIHGDENNTSAAFQLSVALDDGTTSYSVNYQGTPDDLIEGDWLPFNLWAVDLSDFQGVDLTNVTQITITLGGTSSEKVLIDDIELYKPVCLAEKLLGDLNNDCNVDGLDLGLLVNDWLEEDYLVNASGSSPAGLLAWYKFDHMGTDDQVIDSSGNGYDGTITGGFDGIWETNTGYDGGGCIVFDGTYGAQLPSVLFNTLSDELTISVWVNGDVNAQPSTNVLFHGEDSGSSADRILFSNCPNGDGGIYYHSGYKTSDPAYDIVFYKTRLSSEFEGTWNHYIFVTNAVTGKQCIYFNGELKAINETAFAPITTVTDFVIGCNVAASSMFYNGRLDDFRIYNRALTQEEILYLAGRGSITQPILSEADIDDDGAVSFPDFAEIASKWLDIDIKWP
jgi:hypothetical protein